MDDCLTGKTALPDRREKLHDWDVFTAMILAAWIRRFTMDNPNANKVAAQWMSIVTYAFTRGSYTHADYVDAYSQTFGIKPNGGRLVDFVSFYTISMLANSLDCSIEEALVNYVLSKEDGIYYIYDKRLSTLPRLFESREASRYLGAIELLSRYGSARGKLRFVADWLNDNKNTQGKWDMGKSVNDKVYFPLSDNWRSREKREADCTERISALMKALSDN